MGKLILIKGQVPPLTPEQKARLAALKNMSDEDIDYSDIPPLRDDEVGKYRRLRDKPNLWKKIRVKTIEDDSEADLMGEFSLEGFEFEWDDEKYQLNIKKHGIRKRRRMYSWTKTRLLTMMNCTATTKTELKLSAWLKKC